MKWLKRFSLLFVTLFLCFVLLELMLRLLGFKSGSIENYESFKKLKNVDDLIVYQRFFTDKHKIFKGVHGADFGEKKDIHINRDGFRDREFSEKLKSPLPKILFLGDSYTWGATAKPMKNCFVDLVEAEGAYTTFNTGIPGVGPQQYERIASQYIEVLKPDYLAVMYFLGNDLIEDSDFGPGEHLYHVTNASWIEAHKENGEYMSAKEAYLYYHNGDHLYEKAKTELFWPSFMLPLMRKTVIGHTCVRLSDRLNEKWSRVKTFERAKADVHKHLLNIQELGKKANIPVLYFPIPVRPDRLKMYDGYFSYEKQKGVFEGLENVYLIKDGRLKLEHYTPHPDNHFNNEGHAVYKTFILESLKTFREK